MSRSQKTSWRYRLLLAVAGTVTVAALAVGLFKPDPRRSFVAKPPSTAETSSVSEAQSTAEARAIGEVQTTAETPVAAAVSTNLPVFRRGINLSRQQSFSRRDPDRQGAYLWPPFSDDLAQISDSELEKLRLLGFDFIRLPVDAGPFLAESKPHEKILLEDLKQLVGRLHGAGFSVLLDVHPAIYSSVWTPKDILADPKGPKYERYEAFLLTLAGLFHDLPAKTFALELMNEPQPQCVNPDGEDWTVAQKRLYDVVRAKAPDLPLVLTGGCWSSADGLVKVDPGMFDGNTLYDFHFYDPYPFTHQSQYWASPPTRYLAGLSYPAESGSPERTIELSRQHLARMADKGDPQPSNALAKAKREIRHYYGSLRPDQAYLSRRFDVVGDWAKDHGISPDRIVVGEFGAVRLQDYTPDDGSRLRWLKDVRIVAEQHGFGWSLWDYLGGFGLVSDYKTRDIDAGMAGALGLDVSKADPQD